MTATAKVKAKRIPKRLGVDDLKKKIEDRREFCKKNKKEYKGATIDNVQWDTLEYDASMRRQYVVINTVGEDGKLDGQNRRVATSDLQHARYTKDVATAIKRKHNNKKRIDKRKKTK